MKVLLAQIAAGLLLSGLSVHAQEFRGTAPATPQPQITGNVITLWPSGANPTMDGPPLEGWTLPPDWTPAEGGALPQGWPTARGWVPSEGLPSLQNSPPPDGWSSKEWSNVLENAELIAVARGAETAIVTVIRYVDRRGFCWYGDGSYSEGAVRNEERCVCDPYLWNWIKLCEWKPAPS